MRSLVTAAIAAIEAAAAALAGLVIVAIPALLLWAFTFELSAEPATVLASICDVWLLAHWVPLSFDLSPETALGLGQPPEELSFMLSLAPLGITLVTVLLAARAGWRFGRRGGTGAAGVFGGALGFGALVFAVSAVSPPPTPWPGWLVILVPALSYGSVSAVAFAVRAARDEHPWWAAAVRGVQRGMEYLGVRSAAAFPARAAQTLRLATVALAALIGLAALGLAAALIVGYPQVIALTQGLQLDPLGSILLFVAQLALLPVALLWGVAWLTGAGFSVGAGSSVTPFETLLGPLPALPLFGAIPQGWGGLGALAPAILVLAGATLGLLSSRRPGMRRASWGVALAVPITAAVLVGLVVAGLCVLSSGSLGPERLSEAGADPWLTGGLAAAELGLGLLLGAAAGKADYSRLRAGLPEGVVTADALRRLRGGRDAEAPAADDQQTVPLDDAIFGIEDPSEDPAARETEEIRPLEPSESGRTGPERARSGSTLTANARESAEAGFRDAWAEDGELGEAEPEEARPREAGLEAAGFGGSEPDASAGGAETTGTDTDIDIDTETTGPGPGPGEDSETEALLLAYSWEEREVAPDADETDVGRPGWRWSPRKD